MVLPLCSLGCASALLPFCTAVRSPASNRGLIAGDHPRRSAGQRPNSGKRVGAARAAAGTDKLILDQVESHLSGCSHSHIWFTSLYSWLIFTLTSVSALILAAASSLVLTAG